MSVGVVGGSGFYQFPDLDSSRNIDVVTPFGSKVALTTGYIDGKEVVFVARHGSDHRVPPHKVAYRANLWALHSLGVSQIIAINAVGGINADMAPGTLVLPNQLIDYTYGREHTFADVLSEQFNHIDFTEPFSPGLRQTLKQVWSAAEVNFITAGVLACTQGPRLETAAEVLRLQRDGCDVVGMTTMPEAALARELGMDYAAICTVVNWAAGIHPEQPITMADIQAILQAATPLLRQTLVAAIKAL